MLASGCIAEGASAMLIIGFKNNGLNNSRDWATGEESAECASSDALA